VEWHWVIFFIGLSEELSEPHLELIPSFFMGRTKEEVTSHPIWKERREALGKDLPNLPFRLNYHEDANGKYVIIIKSQGDRIYQSLISLLALHEWEVNLFAKPTVKMWLKMRASHELDRSDIDEALMNRMEWQVGRWPDLLVKDPKLQTTALTSIAIGNWSRPEYRSYVENTKKAIEKLYKKCSGYGPGNIRRVEKAIDQDTKSIILSLVPDLVKILRVAWPIKEIVEQKAKAKNLNLSLIKPKHLDFTWGKVKPNDRLDFCSKIVRKYLRDETDIKYALKIIYRTLSGKIPK